VYHKKKILLGTIKITMNMTDKLVKVNSWIRKKIKINKTSSLLKEIKKIKINNSINKINNQMLPNQINLHNCSVIIVVILYLLMKLNNLIA
jgi:hypothetical protein